MISTLLGVLSCLLLFLALWLWIRSLQMKTREQRESREMLTHIRRLRNG